MLYATCVIKMKRKHILKPNTNVHFNNYRNRLTNVSHLPMFKVLLILVLIKSINKTFSLTCQAKRRYKRRNNRWEKMQCFYIANN